MVDNRDGRAPLTDAERAKRYRARRRGEDVVMGIPGRRPDVPDHAVSALRAAGALVHELGFLDEGIRAPEDDPTLIRDLILMLDRLEMVLPAALARLRHDSSADS